MGKEKGSNQPKSGNTERIWRKPTRDYWTCNDVHENDMAWQRKSSNTPNSISSLEKNDTSK